MWPPVLRRESLSGQAGETSWSLQDHFLPTPPRGQCSDCQGLGCGGELSPVHYSGLMNLSSFQPINNADFIVPVEIEGTTHQVSCLRGHTLPTGLWVVLSSQGWVPPFEPFLVTSASPSLLGPSIPKAYWLSSFSSL